MPDWGWLFFAYVSGSIATAWLLWRQLTVRTIETTIDQLMENGFLRYKKDKDGNVEIMKWNSFEDVVNEVRD